jgi:hypothetical protein
MPQSDPPPTKKTDSLGMAPHRRSSPPSEDIELGDEIMMGDAEVTPGEPEIASSLADGGDVEITTGKPTSTRDLDPRRG